MGSAANFKHVPHLLILALILLATCSAHKSSKHNSSRNKSYGYSRNNNNLGYGSYGGSRRLQGNLPGLSNCYSRGAFPCYGIANNVYCYSSGQHCNGISECPMGDDEMNCPSGSNPTRTVFSTRTSTRTTTSTTTTTTTSTTSTTTTVDSTMTSMSTSSRRLTAIVPYQATSSAATLTTTTTKTFEVLMSIVTGGTYPNADVICQDLMAVPAAGGMVPAGPAAYYLRPVTWTLSITPTAHVSCMPSTTTYV